MKVFAYIGSNQGEKSFTKKLCMDFINLLQQNIKEEFEYKIYTGTDTKIKECKGCVNCFVNSFCPLEELDDMKIIKDEMLTSDVIIFASPSYAHNISGNMKKYIDRITSWLHLMKLSGRFGIVMSTCSSSGEEEVCNYLYKMQSYLGIDTIGCVYRYEREYTLEEKLQEEKTLNYLVNKLIERYDKVKRGKIELSNFQKQYYQFLVEKYQNEKKNKIDSSEMKEWYKIYNDKCENFNQFFKYSFLERKRGINEC